MFWARLRLILARAANITLEGIEKIKTQKQNTLKNIFFTSAVRKRQQTSILIGCLDRTII